MAAEIMKEQLLNVCWLKRGTGFEILLAHTSLTFLLRIIRIKIKINK